MTTINRTPASEAVTGLVLDIFRCNSRLLTAGDRLVARLGLTSARWRILAAHAAAERAQPVSWVARGLGANRQNLYRLIDDLHQQGLVGFAANPHHRRAPLVVLTDKGRQTSDAAMRVQAAWINRLSEGLSISDVETARRVMAVVRNTLEASSSKDDAIENLDAEA
jgi:DNA-binding MarR family transcriptional regulator